MSSKETKDSPVSSQEASSSFVDEARASVRADYRGDSPFNEDHRRENLGIQRKLSGPAAANLDISASQGLALMPIGADILKQRIWL